MSTPCPTTGRPCDTPGRCSQPAGCVRKVWPDTDLDKAAVQSLADHLLQRTPEQERQQRAWMFGDWTLELSDTEPEGVVSRRAVHKALDDVDFVAKVRGSVYGAKVLRDSNPPTRCPWDHWKASRDL